MFPAVAVVTLQISQIHLMKEVKITQYFRDSEKCMRPNETIELMTKTKKSKTKNVKLLLRNQLTERNRLKLIQSHDNNNNNKKENTLQVLIIFLLKTFKRVT